MPGRSNNSTPAQRSRIYTAFVGAVLLVAAVHTAQAGTNIWTSNGPDDSYVYTLAIDPETPTTLYAGTDRGMFRSTDGGSAWNPVNTGLPSSTSVTYALAIDPAAPTTLYAGTGGSFGTDEVGGVIKSTDGSATWSARSLSTHRVGALAIDPVTPTTLYAASGLYSYTGLDFGVVKSTDGGITWRVVNTGCTFVSALVIDPAMPTTLYAGTDCCGVVKSTDSGGTWGYSQHGPESGAVTLQVNTLAIDSAATATLYAGTIQGVFKSTNGGDTWSATGLPNGWVFALALDPAMPTTLYAGTGTGTVGVYGGGVFKSTDGGDTWRAFNLGLPVTNVTALAIDPHTPTTVYAGTDGSGVFAIEQAPARSMTPGGCTLATSEGACSGLFLALNLMAVLVVGAVKQRSASCRFSR